MVQIGSGGVLNSPELTKGASSNFEGSQIKDYNIVKIFNLASIYCARKGKA